LIEIAPGIRAGVVRHKERGAVHLAIAVEVEGQVNTAYLDETQMHALSELLLNSMRAASAVRLNRPIPRQRRQLR
jgi:hypothetical protein